MNVVWEDSTALVVNKPVGLLTTAAIGIDSLEVQLRDWLGRSAAESYVGLPHRIDRPVSGAVLVAKTAKATKHFCAQFQTRKIKKTYVAAVAGELETPQTVCRDWMRKLPDRAEAEIVEADHPDAKEAVLRYEVLDVRESVTLVKIDLETGRTHQIRLQFGHRGHPVLGDHLYGSQADFGPQPEDPRRRGIALHAASIAFRHPKNARSIEARALFPESWQALGFSHGLIATPSCG